MYLKNHRPQCVTDFFCEPAKPRDMSRGFCVTGFSGKGDDEVVDLAVQVFESIRDELQGQCSLPLAENKNTVVATKAVLAERVAGRLGPCAEVGAWCKKLGADYALVAPKTLAASSGSHSFASGSLIFPLSSLYVCFWGASSNLIFINVFWCLAVSVPNIHKQIGLRQKPLNFRGNCFVWAPPHNIARLLPCARAPPNLFFVLCCSLDVVLVIRLMFSSCACTAAPGAAAAWGASGPAGTMHCIVGKQCLAQSLACITFMWWARNRFSMEPPFFTRSQCWQLIGFHLVHACHIEMS